MPAISSSFVFLVGFLANTFYVYKPQQNVREMYICFNGNDSWPDAWHSMIPSTINVDSQVFKVEMSNKNMTSYKLRLVFDNRTWGDTAWKNICLSALETTAAETAAFPTVIVWLLYYIAAIVTIIKVKLFTRKIKQKILNISS